MSRHIIRRNDDGRVSDHVIELPFDTWEHTLTTIEDVIAHLKDLEWSEHITYAQVEVVYTVHCGSGVAPNPTFSTYDEALARYHSEVSVPSYIDPTRKRTASITKTETVTTVVTP